MVWLSISIIAILLRRLPCRLDIAWKNRRRRWEQHSRCETMSAAEVGESALGFRHRQKIEQFYRCGRHEWKNENRDLAQGVGGHIEHRALPRRIGLGERPRRFTGKITVRLRHHGPNRI